MSMMISPYIRTIYKSIIFLEKNKDSEALFKGKVMFFSSTF